MLLRENISNTGRTILWISGQKNKAQPSTQVVGYALYSLTILHSTILKGIFFRMETSMMNLNLITEHTLSSETQGI